MYIKATGIFNNSRHTCWLSKFLLRLLIWTVLIKYLSWSNDEISWQYNFLLGRCLKCSCSAHRRKKKNYQINLCSSYFSAFLELFCKLDFFFTTLGLFFFIELRELPEGFDWMIANISFVHPHIPFLSVLRTGHHCKVTQYKTGITVGCPPPLIKNITVYHSNELKTMLITVWEQKVHKKIWSTGHACAQH